MNLNENDKIMIMCPINYKVLKSLTSHVHFYLLLVYIKILLHSLIFYLVALFQQKGHTCKVILWSRPI